MNERPTDPMLSRAEHSAAKWLSLVAISIVAAALFAYLKTCESSKDLGTKAVQTAQGLKETVRELGGIAEKFKTGSISHTFRESIPQTVSTQGDVLELATARYSETFTRTDSMTAAWGWIPLGTTVSEIRVPVTFRYHLRLSERWRLAAKDHVCVVLAPAIRPSLPPALHTDEMKKSTTSGWARWNKDENLAELEKALTPVLQGRAMDLAHQRAVREACRQSVRAFVIEWLIREEHWTRDRFSAVIVVFPDEVAAGSDQDLEAYLGEAKTKP